MLILELNTNLSPLIIMENTAQQQEFLQFLNVFYLAIIILATTIFVFLEDSKKFNKSYFGILVTLFVAFFTNKALPVFVEILILLCMSSVLVSHITLISNFFAYILVHILCIILLRIDFSSKNEPTRQE